MAIAVPKPTLAMVDELAKFTIGQILRGKAGSYTITRKLEACVWSAKNENAENVIIKSVRHFRLENERSLLQRFQHRTPFLRPMIDDIEDPEDPPAIVLRWLDDDVMRASDTKRLTTREIKRVAKGVLEALKVMHEDGYIHADVKPKNILVNYGTGNARFKEVQLADLGGSIHKDSQLAKDGVGIGTEIFRSPEAQLQLPHSPSMDIWSFGATILSLLFGEGFHIFQPTIPFGDPDYSFHVLLRHYRIFGPWPASYNEIADSERIQALNYIDEISPRETLRPFEYIEDVEIVKEDKVFFLKFMKLDPRDRPSAQELLEDEWFMEESPSIAS